MSVVLKSSSFLQFLFCVGLQAYSCTHIYITNIHMYSLKYLHVIISVMLTLAGSSSGTKRVLQIKEDILSSLNLCLDQEPSSPPKKLKSDETGMS